MGALRPLRQTNRAPEQERRHARALAFKVVDFACQKNVANCEAFIAAGGLKTAFPAFMGRNHRKVDKPKPGDSATKKYKHSKSLGAAEVQKLEERLISLMSSLCSRTAAVANGGGSMTPWLRFATKFGEDNFAKVE